MVRQKSHPRRSLKVPVSSAIDNHHHHPSLIFSTTKLRVGGGKMASRNGVTVTKVMKDYNIIGQSMDDIMSTLFQEDQTGRHPLEIYPQVPRLNDLQCVITRAILHHGEPCPFDKIYSFVTQELKGKDIRRRDGTPYATDCKRAIQANLRTNPRNQVSLFKKDRKHKAYWTLCRDLSEALQYPRKTPESQPSPSSTFSSNYVPGPRTRAKQRQRTGRLQPVYKESPSKEAHKLTILQSFVSWLIAPVGRATIDEIESMALPHWPRGSGVVARRAIVICLLKKNTEPMLFERDPTWVTKWCLSPWHPWSDSITKEKLASMKENFKSLRYSDVSPDLEGEFTLW